MAWAISRILGVPWSASSTLRVSANPTSTAAIAVPTENSSQNHSVLPNVNAWYPPSAAQFISTAPPVVRTPLSHPAAGVLPRALAPRLSFALQPPAITTGRLRPRVAPHHGTCEEDEGPAPPHPCSAAPHRGRQLRPARSPSEAASARLWLMVACGAEWPAALSRTPPQGGRSIIMSTV